MSRNKRTRNIEDSGMQLDEDTSNQDGAVPLLGTVPMYSVFERMRDAGQRSRDFRDGSDGVFNLEVRIENIMGQLSQQQSVNYMLLQKMTEMMDKIEMLERRIKKDNESDSLPSYFS